jgi:outer membrane protein with beta-barrel domain
MRGMISKISCVVWMVAALAVGSSTATAQVPQTPQSQSSSQEGLGVQVLGGPLFASFADTNGLDTSGSNGFLVGLGLGGNRGGAVGVEADILYGKKGTTVHNLAFDQHVIDVPVMLKVNIGSASRNGLSVFGLGGGFFDWQFNSTLGNVDISNDTDGYSVGLVAGGGVEFLRFSVQGRYMRALREIDKTFNVGTSTSAKTQAFGIFVAFRLN